MTARIHEAKRTTAGMLDELERRGFTAEFTAIASRHGVLLSEVMSEAKTGGVREARAECMYVLKCREWSWKRIGDLFDRHHESCIRAVQRHEKRLAKAVMRDLRGAA